MGDPPSPWVSILTWSNGLDDGATWCPLCWDPKCLRTTSLPKFQEQVWWNVHGPLIMGPWFPEVCHTTPITNPNSMGRGVHRGTINGPYILYKFQDTVVVLRSADPVCAEEAQSAFVKGWISELDQPKCRTALGQIGRRCWHQFGHPQRKAFIIWLADHRHRIQSLEPTAGRLFVFKAL